MSFKRVITAISVAALLSACTSAVLLEADALKKIEAEGPAALFIDASDVCASTKMSLKLETGKVVYSSQKTVSDSYSTERYDDTEDESNAAEQEESEEEYTYDSDWDLIENDDICQNTTEEQMFERNDGEMVEDTEQLGDDAEVSTDQIGSRNAEEENESAEAQESESESDLPEIDEDDQFTEDWNEMDQTAEESSEESEWDLEYDPDLPVDPDYMRAE